VSIRFDCARLRSLWNISLLLTALAVSGIGLLFRARSLFSLHFVIALSMIVSMAAGGSGGRGNWILFRHIGYYVFFLFYMIKLHIDNY